MTPSRMPSPSFARFFAHLTGVSNPLRVGQAGGAGGWGRPVGQVGGAGRPDRPERRASPYRTRRADGSAVTLEAFATG